MSVPFYCRRCQEMLAEEQAVCPFCGDEAVTVDDFLHERFAARNEAFNEQVNRILYAEEGRA